MVSRDSIFILTLSCVLSLTKRHFSASKYYAITVQYYISSFNVIIFRADIKVDYPRKNLTQNHILELET